MDSSNKWKILTGVGTGIMACYTLLDLYLASQKVKQQEVQDDEIIDEEIKKLNQQLQNHHIFTMKVSDSVPRSPLRKKRSIHKIDRQQTYKICITGGNNTDLPTVRVNLIEQLTDLGFYVLQVPNIWDIIGEKIELSQKIECQVQFYTTLINIQIRLEEFFESIAKMSKCPTVIICKKGVIDLMSYVSDQVWQTILNNNNWKISSLRDNRYEAVVYLVPKKEDDIQFHQDLQKQNSWKGHPHLFIIDNNNKDKNQMVLFNRYNLTIFIHFIGTTHIGTCHLMEKRSSNSHTYLKRLIQLILQYVIYPNKKLKIINQQVQTAITKIIGIPCSNKMFKKYLIEEINLPQDIHYHKFEIEEIVLKDNEDGEVLIRKRGENQNFSYSYIHKMGQKDNTTKEMKRIISPKEYLYLQNSRDVNYRPLNKIRISFFYMNQQFNIDTFKDTNNRLMHLLRVNYTQENADIKMPESIKIIQDVSNDIQYKTKCLAKIDKN